MNGGHMITCAEWMRVGKSRHATQRRCWLDLAETCEVVSCATRVMVGQTVRGAWNGCAVVGHVLWRCGPSGCDVLVLVLVSQPAWIISPDTRRRRLPTSKRQPSPDVKVNKEFFAVDFAGNLRVFLPVDGKDFVQRGKQKKTNWQTF